MCRVRLAISVVEKSFIQSFGSVIAMNRGFDISIYCTHCDSVNQTHRLVWGEATAGFYETWQHLLVEKSIIKRVAKKPAHGSRSRRRGRTTTRLRATKFSSQITSLAESHERTGLCFYCHFPIFADQPGGLNPRHADGVPYGECAPRKKESGRSKSECNKDGRLRVLSIDTVAG